MASSTTTPRKKIRLDDESQGTDSSSNSRPSSSGESVYRRPTEDKLPPSSSGESVYRRPTEDKLPREICKWNEQHITNLSVIISYEDNTTPSELIAMFTVASTSTSRDRICNFEKFYTKFCPFHDKLDEDFSSISRHEAYYLQSRNYYTAHEDAFFSSLNCQSKMEQDKLRHWVRRFETCGEKFAEKLYTMTVKRDFRITLGGDGKERQSLCEYDFQFLFDAFAAMFGLRSYDWSEPFISQSTVQFSKGHASGKADILYCRDIADIEDTSDRVNIDSLMQIVLVCKVKKTFTPPDFQHCRTTREAENRKPDMNVLPPHIPLALLGQHGGELLLYYPQSIKKDVIFGMIVQETKVSFTALNMTAEQYQGIKTGKHETARPKLIITRPYDFMKKEDRKHLIRPMLELARMQENRGFV